MTNMKSVRLGMPLIPSFLFSRNDHLLHSLADSYFSEYGNIRIREGDKEVTIEFLVPGMEKKQILFEC